MKVATIALVVLAAICVAEASRMDFETFKVRFNKQYASEKEHEHRRRIFESNKLIIRRQNIMSKTATFGVTQFADLTQEEFARFAKGTIVPEIDENTPRMEYADDVVKANPDSFDWREKGAVTPVKNQGGCGSCWAFSTTGNIEGQHFISTGKLVSLSEQDLVDCDHECMTYEGQKSCDSGCNGGLQPNAYTYVMKNGGIASEESYPYQGVDGQCHYNSTMKAATISNFTMISTDEDQIATALVNHGPLAIAADATEWQFYLGGVFDLPCGKTLDHGILIVGYGTHKGIFGTMPYWLIKNSWGTTWGEKGYLRIRRGDGKCGLNKFVSTSII